MAFSKATMLEIRFFLFPLAVSDVTCVFNFTMCSGRGVPSPSLSKISDL